MIHASESRTVVLASSPHIVQVVSMLEVPSKFGSTSFQSKDVSGAQKSEFLFWNQDKAVLSVADKAVLSAADKAVLSVTDKVALSVATSESSRNSLFQCHMWCPYIVE